MVCSARTTRATVSGTPSPGCSRPSFCSSPRRPELFWITDSTGANPKRKRNLIFLQIGSSTRLCSLYWVVRGSLPLGERLHRRRGGLSSILLVRWVFIEVFKRGYYLHPSRCVLTGLQRPETTRFCKSHKELKYQNIPSTTSRGTSALPFVNTSPSQETLLSSQKATQPRGELPRIGICVQSTGAIW